MAARPPRLPPKPVPPAQQTKETTKTSPRNAGSKPDPSRPTDPGGDRKRQVSQLTDSTTPQISTAPPPQTDGKPNHTEASPTADLSSLSAQVVSIAQRSGGGLRVTVQFKNASDLPLSVVLDAEYSVLNDDKGESNGILSSNLPKRDSNPRLDLAAGASTTSTFDFPKPLRGSSKFDLNLVSVSGAPIQVGGSPVTLPGSS